MKSSKLASRYAKALFEFAKEKEQIENVRHDLDLVKNVLLENYELKAIVESPVIFPDKKINIFKGIFAEKIGETTFGFLSLIILKKREPSLVTICDEYEILYNLYHNIKIAHVTTAQPLSTKLADSLKQLLEKETQSTIILHEIVDESIIGGFVVRIDDFLFNGSIQARINKLRSEFSHNIYRAAF